MKSNNFFFIVTFLASDDAAYVTGETIVASVRTPQIWNEISEWIKMQLFSFIYPTKDSPLFENSSRYSREKVSMKSDFLKWNNQFWWTEYDFHPNYNWDSLSASKIDWLEVNVFFIKIPILFI